MTRLRWHFWMIRRFGVRRWWLYRQALRARGAVDFSRIFTPDELARLGEHFALAPEKRLDIISLSVQVYGLLAQYLEHQEDGSMDMDDVREAMHLCCVACGMSSEEADESVTTLEYLGDHRIRFNLWRYR